MIKRILLIIEDLFMADFFSDRLSACGLEVTVSNVCMDGVDRFKNEGTDLVLIDPIFSTLDGLDAIRVIREQSPQIPILVLANMPYTMVRGAQSAGATKIISTAANPFETIFAELLLFADDLFDDYKTRLLQADEYWRGYCIGAAPDTIKAMRLDAYSFAKTRSDETLLYSLFRQAHHLAERLAAVGLIPLWKMARSIELLVYDLYEMPEEIGDSTVRTAVQAVDFLGTLFDPAVLAHLSDPAGVTILAVDDEPFALQTISHAMERVGLSLTSALNATDALELLQKEDFKLVLLDIGLPAVNGFDICKQARGIPRCRKTPIVFLTGMATFQNRALSTLSGGNDFIGKPFNLFELGTKALSWVIKGQVGAGI